MVRMEMEKTQVEFLSTFTVSSAQKIVHHSNEVHYEFYDTAIYLARNESIWGKV